jgi:hypothetical protein
MANDQNANDGNQADKVPSRLDKQWGGMENIAAVFSTGEGIGAEAWLIGAFMEQGQDLICQLWDNSGALYTIVYMWNDTDRAMKPLIPHGNNTGEGSAAKAWLVGDFDGNGQDEICQVYATGDAVQMIVYVLQNQEMVVLGATSDTGHGWEAKAWLVGNICYPRGDQQNICQAWAQGDSLGLTIWEWTADTSGQSNGQMEGIWTSHDLDEGWAAEAWLIGDINGDGLDEVIQVWNNDRVAMIVYGWDTDHMKVLWRGDIPTKEGVGALAWLIGDVNGDGLAEIIQIYDNGGTAASIVYAWSGSGMVEIAKNTDLGEGSDAVSWQIGDFNGDGRPEVCQILKTSDPDMGHVVGMNVYAWNDSDSQLEEIWHNSDIQPGILAVFESILVGNVTGGSGDNICQLSNIYGLNIVVYGSTSS